MISELAIEAGSAPVHSLPLDTLGICTEHFPTVMYAATATGINIGLTSSSAEVVANGESTPAFRVDDSNAVR